MVFENIELRESNEIVYMVWIVRRAKIRKDDFMKGRNEMSVSSSGKSNGSGGSIVIVDDGQNDRKNNTPWNIKSTE